MYSWHILLCCLLLASLRKLEFITYEIVMSFMPCGWCNKAMPIELFLIYCFSWKLFKIELKISQFIIVLLDFAWSISIQFPFLFWYANIYFCFVACEMHTSPLGLYFSFPCISRGPHKVPILLSLKSASKKPKYRFSEVKKGVGTWIFKVRKSQKIANIPVVYTGIQSKNILQVRNPNI